VAIVKRHPTNFMARQIIFITLLILTQSVCGQKTKNNLAKIPPGIPTKKELETEERNHNCIKRVNRTFTARLKNYPFNISTQIQFVSFIDSTSIGDSLPRLNDTICYSKLKEVKTLTFKQVDKLTDIFYNYGFRGTTYTISEASCYNPRNAILFLDSRGKAFEFIEICFECSKIQESSEKISVGDLCEQKMDMLKELFKNVGIEYGITKGLITDD
jgi:hypothetical protein